MTAHRMGLATLLQFTIMLPWLPLAVFGGSSGDKGSTIDISFPLPNSNLAGEAERITVRGRSGTARGAAVNQIIVRNPSFAENGKQPPPWLSDSVIAQFDQADPTRWSAQIGLLRQHNEIVIEAADTRNRSRVVTLGLNNAPAFRYPSGIALDVENRQALVVDGGALLAVDLNTGNRTVISDRNTGAGLTVFVSLQDVALDAVNHRALVVDWNLEALLAVDLASGDRSVLSDGNTGVGPAIRYPESVALDAANQRALVVDSSIEAVVAVDLLTGDRTVISDSNTGMGPELSTPNGIALDTSNNRALVVDGGIDALLAVDLITGDRSVISDLDTGTGPYFSFPTDVVLDEANNRALVMQDDADEILNLMEVNLTTGNRTVITDKNNGKGYWFNCAEDVALDAANNRALVTDFCSGLLVTVDLKSGNRSVISNKSAGSGTEFSPVDFVLDTANNRALVLNKRKKWCGESYTAEFESLLLSVDLSTGNRTKISSGDACTGLLLRDPRGVALDIANNRALVTDPFLDALLAVDLDTGNGFVVSNANTGSGPAFKNPSAIALDAAHNQALLLDNSNHSFEPVILMGVDLSTGNRTVISGDNIGAGPVLQNPQSVLLDGPNNRVLITDSFLDALLAVDLLTGNRSVISDANTGSGPDLESPIGVTLDTANNRALIVEGAAGLQGIVAVDLATGNRTILSDNDNSRGAGPEYSDPVNIALDKYNERAFVIDKFNKSLLAIDLGSGDRVIVSQ